MKGVQFDYYESTLTDVFDAAPVVHALGGSVLDRGPARRNYPASYAWKVELGGTVEVWFGAELEVHVVLSSSACDQRVDMLRRMYPHRVSRADVAVDFDRAGYFDEVYPVLHAMAECFKPRPVQTSVAGDWLTPLTSPARGGRTLYLGARKSPMLFRLYEKGYEQAAKHPDQTFSMDWVRGEFQVRPHSRDKARASAFEPIEFACLTSFAAGVCLELLGKKFDGNPALRHVPSTDPLYHLVRQYGPALRDALRDEPNLTVAALLDAHAERSPFVSVDLAIERIRER